MQNGAEALVSDESSVGGRNKVFSPQHPTRQPCCPVQLSCLQCFLSLLWSINPEALNAEVASVIGITASDRVGRRLPLESEPLKPELSAESSFFNQVGLLTKLFSGISGSLRGIRGKSKGEEDEREGRPATRTPGSGTASGTASSESSPTKRANSFSPERKSRALTTRSNSTGPQGEATPQSISATPPTTIVPRAETGYISSQSPRMANPSASKRESEHRNSMEAKRSPRAEPANGVVEQESVRISGGKGLEVAHLQMGTADNTPPRTPPRLTPPPQLSLDTSPEEQVEARAATNKPGKIFSLARMFENQSEDSPNVALFAHKEHPWKPNFNRSPPSKPSTPDVAKPGLSKNDGQASRSISQGQSQPTTRSPPLSQSSGSSTAASSPSGPSQQVPGIQDTDSGISSVMEGTPARGSPVPQAQHSELQTPASPMLTGVPQVIKNVRKVSLNSGPKSPKESDEVEKSMARIWLEAQEDEKEEEEVTQLLAQVGIQKSTVHKQENGFRAQPPASPQPSSHVQGVSSLQSHLPTPAPTVQVQGVSAVQVQTSHEGTSLRNSWDASSTVPLTEAEELDFELNGYGQQPAAQPHSFEDVTSRFHFAGHTSHRFAYGKEKGEATPLKQGAQQENGDDFESFLDAMDTQLAAHNSLINATGPKTDWWSSPTSVDSNSTLPSSNNSMLQHKMQNYTRVVVASPQTKKSALRLNDFYGNSPNKKGRGVQFSAINDQRLISPREQKSQYDILNANFTSPLGYQYQLSSSGSNSIAAEEEISFSSYGAQSLGTPANHHEPPSSSYSAYESQSYTSLSAMQPFNQTILPTHESSPYASMSPATQSHESPAYTAMQAGNFGEITSIDDGVNTLLA